MLPSISWLLYNLPPSLDCAKHITLSNDLRSHECTAFLPYPAFLPYLLPSCTIRLVGGITHYELQPQAPKSFPPPAPGIALISFPHRPKNSPNTPEIQTGLNLLHGDNTSWPLWVLSFFLFRDRVFLCNSPECPGTHTL